MIRQFVSYPKSGRTWIRYMLKEAGVSDAVVYHHDEFEFNDGAKPPLNFDTKARLERYKYIDKLVYLERDPRDVMVSLFHQVTGRFKDFFNYEGTISDFIRDDYFGAQNLKKHQQMWNEICTKLGFLKVTYEECHADPKATLKKICDYYEFEVPDEKLAEAAEKGQFENMKKVEQSGEYEEPWLRTRNDAPKVRRGKVQGFRDSLNEQDIEYLNKVFDLDRRSWFASLFKATSKV